MALRCLCSAAVSVLACGLGPTYQLCKLGQLPFRPNRRPIAAAKSTSPPQSNFKRARRSRTTIRNKVPRALVTIGRSTFTQNCPFPFDDNHPHLIYPSLDRPHSPRQTASESNQPFCHSTLCGPEDRPIQTHGPTDGVTE